MKFIGIIPARYASSRFPGKPLCIIDGLPMIVRVYRSANKWDKWQNLYLATDDERIRKCCEEYKIPCIMTRDDHTDCLDRCAEAANKLKEQNIVADRYIIVQGDEPLFNANTLNADYSKENINFYTKITEPSEIDDQNVPKIVVSKSGRALYFSRYGIPFHDPKTKRTKEDPVFYKQIGVYAMSLDQLNKYVSLSSTNLENFEGIGLNRLLENDIDVYMAYTEFDSVSVDTESDRQKVEKIILDSHEQS
jgi:3-deoxy-manno-octulosonate cytidylyltransferase (CMP-KDO synthetase)